MKSNINEIINQMSKLQDFGRKLGIQLSAATFASFCLFKFACDNAEALDISIDKFHSFSAMAKLFGSFAGKQEVIDACLEIERALDVTNCSPSTYIDQFLSKILNTSEAVDILNYVADMDLEDADKTGIFADALSCYITQKDPEYNRAMYGTYADIAQLMTHFVNSKAISNVYDGCCGMGQCLYELRKANPNIKIYGQDKSFDSVTIGTILQIMSFAKKDSYTLQVGDTLTGHIMSEAPLDDKYDAVMMAPPVFTLYEAPIGKGVFAYDNLTNKRSELMFLLHAIASLKDGGIGVLHVPMGMLFAGGKVEMIRRTLVENGHIRAVIALPQGCIVGTNIPSAILMFSTEKQYNDVLFVDTANINEELFFQKTYGRVQLTSEGMEKLVSIINERTELEGISAILTPEALAGKDYLLTPDAYLRKADELRLEYIPLSQLRDRENELLDELAKLNQEFEKLISIPMMDL